MLSIFLYSDEELVTLRTETARKRGLLLAAHSPDNPMPAGVKVQVRHLWSITDQIDAELIARREDRAMAPTTQAV